MYSHLKIFVFVLLHLKGNFSLLAYKRNTSPEDPTKQKLLLENESLILKPNFLNGISICGRYYQKSLRADHAFHIGEWPNMVLIQISHPGWIRFTAESMYLCELHSNLLHTCVLRMYRIM